MSRFSPGPWIVAGDLRADTHGDRILSVQTGRLALDVIQPPATPVVVAVANVNLIAASPEMFEALDEFVGAHVRGITPELDAAFDLARAALAKAKVGA